MHKVFISYHHGNDQPYKNRLLEINNLHRIFIDQSVDTGDISDALNDAAIREKIRDEYLRDTTVTIVLVGLETKGRKHVDWEIYSSMFDGTVNKRSGILVVCLPPTLDYCTGIFTAHADEQKIVYPECSSWDTLMGASVENFAGLFPHIPDRIIDNLAMSEAAISVTPWYTIANDPAKLSFLIESTFRDREACKYDLRRPMRRANS